MHKFYFLGEFGYGFRQLLPFLEKYPEKCELLTWNGLCVVIDILWPKKFILTEAETIIKDIKDVARLGINYFDQDTVALVENMGYVDITTLDNEMFYNGDFIRFDLISKKITYGEQHKDKKYISIFPRKRQVWESKNNITDEHLLWVKEKYPDKKIIGHGLVNERQDMNIYFCKDIYEQINVFNNSVCFVSPASGLVDLALMCGCNVVLTYFYRDIEKANPQKCKIRYFENLIIKEKT